MFDCCNTSSTSSTYSTPKENPARPAVSSQLAQANLLSQSSSSPAPKPLTERTLSVHTLPPPTPPMAITPIQPQPTSTKRSVVLNVPINEEKSRPSTPSSQKNTTKEKINNLSEIKKKIDKKTLDAFDKLLKKVDGGTTQLKILYQERSKDDKQSRDNEIARDPVMKKLAQIKEIKTTKNYLSIEANFAKWSESWSSLNNIILNYQEPNDITFISEAKQVLSTLQKIHKKWQAIFAK